MANNNPTPLRGGGLSLYANLLDPSPTSSATISRAPVAFQPSETINAGEVTSQKHQINAAALRFQPTKRPQLASQKGKPKHAVPRALPPSNNDATTGSTPQRPPTKTTFADWAVGDDDDVNGFYASGGPKPQRGGKKRRKKNKEEYVVPQSWDDYYDPTRPTNYEEYKHSEERISEIREWRDRLYAHRQARRHTSNASSDREAKPYVGNQFAPPTFNAFAPPPSFAPPPPGPPPTDILDLKTEDDAFTRRLAPNQGIVPATSTGPLTKTSSPEYSPPPPEASPAVVISRAPVRYTMPSAPDEIPATEGELAQALADEGDHAQEAEEDDRRTNRPGQKGFAERLMSKYGWSKGSGLGADGSGIINPLHVQVQKRKKKPDSEGGGFATPTTGKIVGGKRNTPSGSDVGKFGAMSEVICLKGMIGENDVDDEGGLIQEIGEECAEKYGRVERVFIWRQLGQKAMVFVKFTSQLSALRAVNALEGRNFDGNSISAMFYDTERFEAGIYQ